MRIHWGTTLRLWTGFALATVGFSCSNRRAGNALDAQVADQIATLTNAPVCYGASGVQASAPSPMVGLCPAHRNQSPAVGAQTSAKAAGWTSGIALSGVVRSAPVISSAGTIFAGSTARIYGLNANGSTRWFLTPGMSTGSSAGIGADGNVYMITSETSPKVRSLAAADGASRWSVTINGAVSAGPAFSPDGATVYIATQTGRLYALNTTSGATRWSITKGAITTSPAIAADGTIYVGADDGLYAINPSSGATLWTRTFGSGGFVRSSPAIAADGTIYVGTDLKKLEATNPDGTARWSYTATGMGLVRSSPAVATDGTIYFGTRDKKLYALNANGTLKWAFLTGGVVDSSPAIGADGTVYVGSDDFKLYAIKANGTQLFNVATGNFIRGGVAIGRNGTVYVGSDDQKLWAFGPGSCGSSDTSCDGRDDNCSGSVDEGYASQATSCGVGACARTGATSCVNGAVQNSCVAGMAALSDTTCDAIDDNCDGTKDEGYVSTPTTCGQGACARSGATSCVNGVVQNSCVAGMAGTSDTTCNGIDDNCDGTKDEGYVGTATSCGTGPCARTGTGSCVNGAVQSNCTAGTPAANDTSCNGVDDNCDGTVDDGCTSAGLPYREDFEAAPPASLPATDLSSRFETVSGDVVRGTRVSRGARAAEFGSQIYLQPTVPAEVVKFLNTSGYSNVNLRFWRLLGLDPQDTWTVRYSTSSSTGPWTQLESLTSADGTWHELATTLPSSATLWLSFTVNFGPNFHGQYAFLDEIRVTGDRTCTTAANCDDSFACTTDQCVSGTCQHVASAVGTACSDRSLIEGGTAAGRCDGSHCVECVTDADCPERDGLSCTTPVCQGQQCSEQQSASCNLSWGESCTPATAKFVPNDIVPQADGNSGAGFAWPMAASGDRVVIGAAWDGPAATADGAAFVYRYDGSSWIEEAKLVASDPTPESSANGFGTGGGFGATVAIDGSTVAVGAWSRDQRQPSVVDAGAVYVFDNSTGVWQQRAELYSPEVIHAGTFGSLVAISGDWLAVGGFDTDTFAVPVNIPGAIYLFHRVNGQWTYTQKLKPADLSFMGDFGSGLSSMALSGDLLLANGHAIAGDSIRSTLYAFHNTGSTWTQIQAIRPSDSQADTAPVNDFGGDFGDGYGSSISIDGNLAFVGAWGRNGERPDQGAVYIYRYTNGTWQQVQEIVSPDQTWGAQFGNSVAVRGTTAVVTATVGDPSGSSFMNPALPGFGKAYVYQYDTAHDTWLLARALTPSDAGATPNMFGASAAIAQGTVFVGAPGASAPNFSVAPGAAYAYACGSAATPCFGVQSCIAHDGCCPFGCTASNDSDCGTSGGGCSAATPCGAGTGPCTGDAQCNAGLFCGGGVCAQPIDVPSTGATTVQAEQGRSSSAPAGGAAWQPYASPDAIGGAALQALPNTGVDLATNFVGQSPLVEFPIQVVQPGTYYVWVRGAAPSGTGDDTVHVGLDGAAVASTSNISDPAFLQGFGWSHYGASGAVAQLQISSTGPHVLDVWMAKDGFVFDELSISNDATYAPAGVTACSTSSCDQQCASSCPMTAATCTQACGTSAGCTEQVIRCETGTLCSPSCTSCQDQCSVPDPTACNDCPSFKCNGVAYVDCTVAGSTDPHCCQQHTNANNCSVCPPDPGTTVDDGNCHCSYVHCQEPDGPHDYSGNECRSVLEPNCACGAHQSCVRVCQPQGCVEQQQPGCIDPASCTGVNFPACANCLACKEQCTATACQPSCAGKACGPDGALGSCGTCPSGSICNASGQCEQGPQACVGDNCAVSCPVGAGCLGQPCHADQTCAANGLSCLLAVGVNGENVCGTKECGTVNGCSMTFCAADSSCAPIPTLDVPTDTLYQLSPGSCGSGQCPAAPASIDTSSCAPELIGDDTRVDCPVLPLVRCDDPSCGLSVGTLPGGFAVSYLGSATYQIPLELPPGRNGVVPQLALGYDSSRGNGVLGAGWALSGLHQISRCPETLTLDERTRAAQLADEDVYCLDGARLVQIAAYTDGGAEVREYRTAVEAFQRIQGYFRADGLGPDHFVVHDKSGLISEYGTGQSAAQVYEQGRDPGEGPIFIWALSKVKDRTGAILTITYYQVTADRSTYVLRDGGLQNELEPLRELYPRRISYGAHETDGAIDSTYQVLIDFVYRTQRADNPNTFVRGTELQTKRLLQAITATVGGKIVRQYGFDYDTPVVKVENMSTRVTVTGHDHQAIGNASQDTVALRSRLLSVQACGETQTSGSQCWPATKFDYDDGRSTIPYQSLSSAPTRDTARRQVASPPSKFYEETYPMDIDGDGRTDILAANGRGLYVEGGLIDPHYQILRSVVPSGGGAATFQIVDTTVIPRAGSGLVLDWDNDGDDDLLEPGRIEGTDEFSVLLAENGTIVRHPTGLQRGSAHDFGVVYVLDLDGNGLRDLLICEDAVYSSDGKTHGSWSYRLHDGNSLSSAMTWNMTLETLCPLGQTQGGLAHQGSQAIDLDGDGAQELLFWNSEVKDWQILSVDTRTKDGKVLEHPMRPDVFVKGPERIPPTAIPGQTQIIRFDVKDPQRPIVALDANGDGMTDLLRISRIVETHPDAKEPDSKLSIVELLLSRGDGTFEMPAEFYTGDAGRDVGEDMYWRIGTELITRWLDALATARVFDADGDGRQDLLVPSAVNSAGSNTYQGPAEIASWFMLRSTGRGFVVSNLKTPIPSPFFALSNTQPSAHHMVPNVLDMDGDGDPEFVYFDAVDKLWYSVAHLGQTHSRLREVKDGLGAKLAIDYKNLTSNSVYGRGTPTSGEIRRASPRYVVSTHYEWDDPFDRHAGVPTPARQYDYTYNGQRISADGQGLLGFDERTIEKTEAPNYHTRRSVLDYEPLRQDPLTGLRPFGGMPTSRTEYFSGNDTQGAPDGIITHYTQITSTLASNNPALADANGNSASARTVFPYIAESDETNFEAGQSAPYSQRSLVVSQLDNYGNALRTLESGGAGDTLERHLVLDYEDHPSDERDWLIGLVHRDEVTSTAPPNAVRGAVQSATRVTQYDYQDGLLVTQTRSPDDAEFQQKTTFEREPVFGNVDSATLEAAYGEGSADVRQRKTTIHYDDFWLYPRETLNAKDQPTTVGFDPATGKLTSLKDVAKRTATTQIGPLGRVDQVERLDGTSTTYAYSRVSDQLPMRIRTVESDGRFLENDLDVRGREKVTHTQAAAGKNLGIERDYSSAGLLTKSTTVGDSGTRKDATRTNDSLGRPLVEVAPDTDRFEQCYFNGYSCTLNSMGHASCVQRDGSGRVVASYDPNIEESTTCSAALSAVQGRTDAMRYYYGAFGQLEAVQDVAGKLWQYHYDDYGRLLDSSDPDSGAATNGYNAFDELRRNVDAAHEVHFEYDQLGRRISSMTWAPSVADDPNPQQNKWYWDGEDESGTPVLNSDELIGTLTAAEVVGGRRTRFSYDAQGHKTAEHSIQSGHDDVEVDYTYYPFGRLQTIKYPATPPSAQLTIEYRYDNFGYLQEVGNLNGGGVYYHRDAVDEFGRNQRECVNDSAVCTTIGYDDVNRITSLSTTDTRSGGGDIQHLEYDYAATPGSNLDVMYDRLHGFAERYAYDRYDRIHEATVTLPGDATALSAQTFDYYDNGNIRTRSDVGTYVYDGPAHAATAAGAMHFEYDDAGQRVRAIDANEVARRYEYGGFGLPTKIYREDSPATSAISYEYDAFNTRSVRRTASETTTYLADLYERRDSGATKQEILYIRMGDSVVATRTVDASGVTTQYLHQDRLGSTQTVSTAVAGQHEDRGYDVFGDPRHPNLLGPAMKPCTGPSCNGDASQRVGYTGHRDEWELDLLDMGGRIYDSRIGQFTTPDPLQTNLYWSQRWNAYSYVENNPLSRIDPDGLDEVRITEGHVTVETTYEGWEGSFDGSWNQLTSFDPPFPAVPVVTPVDPYVAPTVNPARDGAGGAGAVAPTGAEGQGGSHTIPNVPISTIGRLRAVDGQLTLGDELFDPSTVIPPVPTGMQLAESLIPTPWEMIGGVGAEKAAVAIGLRASLAGTVLLDSNVVAQLAKDATLGGRLAPGERAVVSYVTGPELRNAVAKGSLKGVPKILQTLAVFAQRPTIDAIISFRGALVRAAGRFGDGIIGAQAIEYGLPLITNDKELAAAVRAAGGVVRDLR